LQLKAAPRRKLLRLNAAPQMKLFRKALFPSARLPIPFKIFLPAKPVPIR
jgi:hypothetical protein